MAMKRCDADLHFFDSDKDKSCPYCRDQSSEFDATIGVQPGKHGDGREDDSGETVSVYDKRTQGVTRSGPMEEDEDDDAGKTIGIYQDREGYDPVVGWLVCIEGASKGRDYRIKTGINEVGRNSSQDVQIVISGDKTISKRDHAEIEYDEGENTYYLIRKKNQAVKLNGNNVRQPTQLTAYDTIQFGQSSFMFVPLCTEKFKWTTEDDTL